MSFKCYKINCVNGLNFFLNCLYLINIILFVVQKISPEGKPKIQLQVVLHDNTTSTFQFVNRQGPSVATKERDQVKDLLVQLLPKFKRKVNKELEEKNR